MDTSNRLSVIASSKYLPAMSGQPKVRTLWKVMEEMLFPIINLTFSFSVGEESILFNIFECMINMVESRIEEVKRICTRHSVAELYLYGSAVSGTHNSNSDLDFAVVFNSSLSPLEKGDAFFSLMDDLEALFECPIDLISYQSIKNPIFIEELNSSKISLYAA